MPKRPMCLLCLIFMVGIWILDVSGGPFQEDAPGDTIIREYLQNHKNIVRIYGTIYRRSMDHSAVYLKNSHLKVQSKIIPLENVKVYMDQEEHLPIGAGILVAGKLEKIPKPGNPGQFDSSLYYQVQHIGYRMTKGSARIIKVPALSLRELLAGIRESMARGFAASAGDYSGIYQAMILGDKSLLKEETKDRFRMAGILHMLAISGLHLSLLGMGCFSLLQRMGVSLLKSGGISVILLFGYGIFTGESVSVMRALFMFVLVMGARILGRSYDLLTALSCAAIFILLDSPSYLYYSGFQLSFASVLGIAVVFPALEKITGAGEIRREKLREGGRKKSSCVLGVLRGFLASLAVQLTSLPITLYWFYEIPLWGVFFNLLVIPTMSLVVVSGFACGGAGAFLPSLGRLLAAPGCLMLFVYESLGRLAQKLPAAMWVAGKPNWVQILMYYIIVGGVLKLLLWKKISTKTPKVGRLVILLGVVAVSLVILSLKHREPLQITCLDVGQGDCTVVSTETDGHYLIDGGSSNVGNVGRYRILPYLKSQGITVLEAVWVSHTDSDHISGVLELLEMIQGQGSSLKIKRVILSPMLQPGEDYKKLEKAAKGAGADLVYVTRGDILKAGKLRVKVLAPREADEENPNESSQVLKLEFGEFQGIFTGDIGMETEGLLLGELGDVEFLKIAHHGSKNSTGDLFLKETRPEIGVISASSTNSYGHPHPDTLSRLKAAQVQVWCTKDKGAVTVTSDGVSGKVTGFLD